MSVSPVIVVCLEGVEAVRVVRNNGKLDKGWKERIDKDYKQRLKD